MDNPSLWSEKCRDYAKRAMVGFKLQSVRIRENVTSTYQHELVNNTIVARLGGGPGEPGWLDCYPWGFEEAALVEAFHHKPYRRFAILSSTLNSLRNSFN